MRYTLKTYRSLAVLHAVWILHDRDKLVLVRGCSRIHMMEVNLTRVCVYTFGEMADFKYHFNICWVFKC